MNDRDSKNIGSVTGAAPTAGEVALADTNHPSALKRIAIFGSADVDENHPLYKEVFNVARTLAYHGKTIVDGGGPGTMLAATQGAESAGGETLIVTFYPKDAPEFEGRAGDNIADREIRTENYIERMLTLIDNADAFICFQGGTGTLSEWATVWLMAHIYYGHHKPIILYGRFWHDVMRTIKENFFIGKSEEAVYKIVENPDQLMLALDLFEMEVQGRKN